MQASRDPEGKIDAPRTNYELLARAAQLNEPRVRELIALAREIHGALEEPTGLVDYAAALDRSLERCQANVRALEFGLGALLPPVQVRLRVSLGAVKSVKRPAPCA